MKLSALLARAQATLPASVADREIAGVCALTPGEPDALAWCGSVRLAEQARQSRAAVILVPPDLADLVPQAVPVPHPQAVFSGVAAAFAPDDRPAEGIHPSAVIDAKARLGAGVRIGPLVSVAADAEIGGGVSLGAGTVVGRGVRIGEDSRIGARVVIEPRSQIGARALILPGAVIGSRGFGNYHDGSGWKEIPQLGRAVLGDDVEVGANATIDCGALGDTVIGDNVRIDNLCQVAHNVHIGAQTALAAQVGVAGSTTIGKGCMLGGQAGVNGHIRITDGVIISGGSAVLQNVDQPGQYGSGSPLLAAGPFRRLMVLLRQLEPRLKSVEKALRS
ncbi:MAG: UDP-3-O-(3-hydroxymyristoyl)glucosamine N-acyltransferase [Oceanococcaceae bacterium]